MGREIRKVPPEHQHPTDESGHYKVMHDRNYEVALKEWEDEKASYNPDDHDGCSFEDWRGSKPDPENHHNYKPEDCTWFQMYETVTEGTPITPAFETEDKLVEYLVGTDDGWGNNWDIETATYFVKEAKHLCSMAMIPGKGTLHCSTLARYMMDQKEADSDK